MNKGWSTSEIYTAWFCLGVLVVILLALGATLVRDFWRKGWWR